MINKLFIVVMSLIMLSACKQDSKNSFSIKGEVKNANAKMVYLQEIDFAAGTPVTVDSGVVSEKGVFSLSTKTKEERLYYLKFDQQPYPFLSVINDASSISVTGDINLPGDNFKIEGSEASNKMKEFFLKVNENSIAYNQIGKQYDSLSKAGASQADLGGLIAQGNIIMENMKAETKKTIAEVKSPVLALMALQNGGNMFQQDEFTAALDSLTKRFPKHEGIKTLQTKLIQQLAAQSQQQSQQAATSLIGKPAPEFALNDVNGKEVKLSSFKGKFVLVDFWASWCKPCREENPNVVAAYNKFKNKNFTILGVSLDQKADAWKKAIEKDQLTWTHISDLQYWNSAVVPLYHLEGIPYNVLLNPEGIVIAESLRGGMLEAKLGEVLN